MDHNESVQSGMPRPGVFRRRTDIDRRNNPDIPGEPELRIAIEAAGLGLFDYYPLNGELYWNHTAKSHFGLSPDAHVNYNLFLVGLHPGDRTRVNTLIQNALKKENDGKCSIEYRTIGIEDGGERWISMRGQAFFNAAGEGVRFTGTMLDVSESRRNEDNLRESREHWKLLFDKSPLPKWIVDLESLSFLDVNEAAMVQFGYTRDEFKKISLADVRTPDEFEKFRNRLKESFSPGQEVEGPIPTKHLKKNREVVNTIIHSTEIMYKGRRAILSVMTDH